MRRSFLLLFFLSSFFALKAQKEKEYIPKTNTIKAKIENAPADGLMSAEEFKKVSKILLEGPGSENYQILSCNITLKIQSQPVVLSCLPINGELNPEVKTCLQKGTKMLFIDNIIVLNKNEKKKFRIESIIKLQSK